MASNDACREEESLMSSSHHSVDDDVEEEEEEAAVPMAEKRKEEEEEEEADEDEEKQWDGVLAAAFVEKVRGGGALDPAFFGKLREKYVKSAVEALDEAVAMEKEVRFFFPLARTNTCSAQSCTETRGSRSNGSVTSTRRGVPMRSWRSVCSTRSTTS
jgi:hypothetical protein